MSERFITHRFHQRRVITDNVYPPIPIRCFDWCAYLDGQEEGTVGTGATEQAAIDDLKQQLEEAE